MKEKNSKIAKSAHAFKRYASSYKFEISNSFNPELQLKYTESAIKNKLIDILIELKGSKFVTTLVLEFKKIQSDDKTLYSKFYSNSKQKQLLMKVTLMMYSNESIVLLYQTYKNLRDKDQARLLIRS